MGKLSDEEKLAVKAGMVVAGILSTFALRYVEPTRGVGKLAMVSHALFAVFAVALCFAPEMTSTPSTRRQLDGSHPTHSLVLHRRRGRLGRLPALPLHHLRRRVNRCGAVPIEGGLIISLLA